MAVLLVSDYGEDPNFWRRELSKRGPEVDLRAWPEAGNEDEIEVVIIDTLMAPKGGFGPFKNLRWVSYLGHGVGDVVRDPSLPSHVQVTRLHSMGIARGLSEYAVHAVLSHHLRVADYAAQQRTAVWHELAIPPPARMKIAVLGLGVIGRTICKDLQYWGFDVTGWRRGLDPVEGVRSVGGGQALPGLLAENDCIVAALPETEETVDLIGRDALARMKPGAYIVNVGRGSLIDEDALLEAIEGGRLAGATLDVFREEPLPPDSPLWHCGKIRITPHSGSPASDDPVEVEIAENYRRFSSGEPLHGLVDRDLGY